MPEFKTGGTVPPRRVSFPLREPVFPVFEHGPGGLHLVGLEPAWRVEEIGLGVSRCPRDSENVR